MVRYFTADTHFGHRNIIQLCRRPFTIVEEMDAEIIKRWNACVKPDDEVFHLGDFAWRDAEKYLAQLAGKLHLIVGNHDHSVTKRSSRWLSVQKYIEINNSHRKFVLQHKPLNVWSNMADHAIHLHGHSHGLGVKMLDKYDVGIDTTMANFAPISEMQLIS